MIFGMGCWQIGGPKLKNGKPDGWAIKDESSVENLINHAIKSGVTFFDTSPTYGFDSQSEKMLGKFLPNDSSIQLCTKFGWKADISGKIVKDYSVSNLFYSLEKSLLHLKRDQIDTFLLHGFPEKGYINDGVILALESLKTQGVIKHWGVSPSTFQQAALCLERNYGDTLEWVYNLLERRIENLFPLLIRLNINFIARSPFASGLIHPRLISTDYNSFNQDDFSSHHDIKLREWYKQQLIRFQGNSDDLIPIAFRYFLDKPIFKVIPGIRSIEHIDTLNSVYQLGKLTKREQFEFIDGLPEFYPNFQ